MIIGIVLGLTNAGAVMPEFAKLTLKNLGSSMAPLAMILTGFIIGDYDFMSLLKMPGVYVATALRLFVFPLLFVGLFWLVGVTEPRRPNVPQGTSRPPVTARTGPPKGWVRVSPRPPPLNCTCCSQGASQLPRSR